jgi:hypothetical protein
VPRRRGQRLPRGPFVDRSAEPMVCQFDLGGSIDANPFRDRTASSTSTGRPTGTASASAAACGAELTPDGLKLAGAPKDIGLTDEDAWEQKVIEAPTMLRTPDGYAMLYSGGYFGWNPTSACRPMR